MRACAAGESAPSRSTSAEIRPDSGPKKPTPARNVTAKSASAMTIQSSPKPQASDSQTSAMPAISVSIDAIASTRSPIHLMSSANAAIRFESPEAMARMAKNCVATPPPSHVMAAPRWTNSRKSYSVNARRASGASSRRPCRP